MRHDRLYAYALIAVTVALVGTPSPAAEVYRWVDEGGVVHFSQWAPAGPIEDVATLTVEESTPLDYDPADDPYSILNQSERIHELWSDLQARSDEQERDRGLRSASRELPPDTYDDDRRYAYPYFLARPPHFFPHLFDRVPLRRLRRQQRILDEFDRVAGPPAHSINSSLHRAQIEAKREIVATSRRQGLKPE